MATESNTDQIEQMEADIAAWTAGSLLRVERDRQGLSEKQVADQLHITMHYVRAIESDRYDKLPGTIFAKGYIKSYAAMLGLDENAVLNLFDDLVVREEIASVTNQRRRRGLGRNRILPWLILALLAFVAGYGALWAYQYFFASASTGVSPVSNNALAQAGYTSERQGVVERADPGVPGSKLPAPERGLSVREYQVLAPGLDQEAQGISPRAREGLPEQLVEVVTLGTDLLQISFNDETLVDVTGAGENYLYRDMHKAGDLLRITGRAPFNVLLGDARSARVTLNGSEIDVLGRRRIDNSVSLVVGI